MHYTIGHFTQCCNTHDLEAWINQSGNKYDVELSARFPGDDIRRKNISRRTFDNLTEAYKVFEKLVSWMVFGLYTEEQKRAYLETGTMA